MTAELVRFGGLSPKPWKVKHFFSASKPLTSAIAQARLFCRWSGHHHEGQCGERNDGFLQRSCPNPQTWECVTLHGQRDFTEVMNVRILRWKGYPETAR